MANASWPYHLYTGNDPKKQGSYVKCKNNPCMIHGGTDIMATSPEDAYNKANENNTWGWQKSEPDESNNSYVNEKAVDSLENDEEWMHQDLSKTDYYDMNLENNEKWRESQPGESFMDDNDLNKYLITHDGRLVRKDLITDYDDAREPRKEDFPDFYPSNFMPNKEADEIYKNWVNESSSSDHYDDINMCVSCAQNMNSVGASGTCQMCGGVYCEDCNEQVRDVDGRTRYVCYDCYTHLYKETGTRYGSMRPRTRGDRTILA